MVRLVGFNGFPQVMADKAYKAVRGKELYRGQDSMEYHAQLLVDFDYHYGAGWYADGIYASTDPNTALNYTYRGGWRSALKKNPKRILRFKLSDDAIIIKEHALNEYVQELVDAFKELEKYRNRSRVAKFFTPYRDKNLNQYFREVIAFAQKLPEDEFKMFKQLIASQDFVAMLLGADAILIDNSDFVVLNRAKVVTCESEFKRVTKHSKNYHDGVIDFDAKSDEEFLRE